MRLVDAALIDRDGNAGHSAGLRRAGEILEWLSEPGLDNRELEGPGLELDALAAACYQLAGYPARALGVMRVADGVVRDSLLGRLLSGDLNGLLPSAAEDAARTRRQFARMGNAGVSEVSQETVVPQLVRAEVASALGAICAEIRWGEENRTETALSKLRAAARVLRGLRDPYAWLLIRLVCEVATETVRTSLRAQVAGLRESTAAGEDVLERYVRLAFSEGRSTAWPSQIRGLDRLTIGDSFALCTPTGSGKTTVAEVALLDGLFRELPEGIIDFSMDATAPLCLYVVPSRALAAEIEGKLSRVLTRAGGPRAVTVTGLYGGTDWGPTDVWLTNEEPTVLICTQEKAEALVRFFGREFLRRLRLVIVDEAHNVQHVGDDSNLLTGEDRALRLESLVTRLRANLGARDTRFIALSAVAQQIEQALARWISGDAADTAVTSDYRSTRQLVGRLVCRRRGEFQIIYDRLDGSPLTFADSEDSPYVPRPFPAHPAATGMDGPAKGIAPYALWAAMHLAAPTATGTGAVLISVAENVRNFANWCIQLLEEHWQDVDLPEFFSRPQREADRDIWEAALSACADYFGIESREHRLLERGIVVHHGKMPGRLPRLLVQLIDRRIVRIAIATSTLSEGVNLPFETVLIPGLRRFDGGLMSGREFGNLVGRVGRPGVSTEGQALVLLRDSGLERWQLRAARENYASVLAAWTNADVQEAAPRSGLAELIEIVSEGWNGNDDDFIAWLESTAPADLDEADMDDAAHALDALDAQILAAITEIEEFGLGLSELDGEERLRALWRESYAHYASIEERRLERIFVQRGTALEARVYPDREVRRRYYRASLPPRDAREMVSLAPVLRDHLSSGEAYAEWESDERIDFIIETITLTSSLSRFELRETVGRSKVPWQDVIHWWLSPSTAETQPSESQVAAWLNFADKDVNYRFNWAIGSLLSLLSDETSDGNAVWASPEAWERTELPFVALWLKDLITWGTLDPVAAYLMARGGAQVRSEAEELASGYYEDTRRTGPENDVLDPDAVRAWATENFPLRRRESPVRPPRSIPARLLRPFPSGASRDWRVLPLVGGDRLIWVDPAGFRLARSGLPREWDDNLVETADFFLQPKARRVISRPFI